MDLLTDILRTFRLDVDIVNNAQYCGDWGIDTSGTGYVSFHLITHGHCYASSPCLEKPIYLETGDFILFPHDAPHVIEPRLGCQVTLNQVAPINYEHGLNEDAVGILCGYFRFTNEASNPLLEMLPKVMVKQLRQAPINCPMAALLKVIQQEAIQQKPGYQAAINRLTESLFVLLVRDHINQASDLQGLAAALMDSRISKALDAIHRQPEKNWNVDELSALANMSRSAFADVFKKLLGEAPMSYLSRWRMQLATVWLAEDESIYAVALRCGYESEAAFAKAFKRIVGKTPGQARKAAHQGTLIAKQETKLTSLAEQKLSMS